jgi:hypothetical protein
VGSGWRPVTSECVSNALDANAGPAFILADERDLHWCTDAEFKRDYEVVGGELKMSDHTKTPWHIAGKATIKMGQNDWIGTVNWRNRDANAAFLVRAVNAHDALVAALDAARSQLRTLGGDHRPYADYPDSDRIQGAVLDMIDTALSLAKAGS